MQTLIISLIVAILGMAVVVPVVASERLKVGEYAIVRFIRRKGSTTEWKEGAKVQVIDEHVGEDIGIDQESDYTVITKNGDVAFPKADQLEKIKDIK